MQGSYENWKKKCFCTFIVSIAFCIAIIVRIKLNGKLSFCWWLVFIYKFKSMYYFWTKKQGEKNTKNVSAK